MYFYEGFKISVKPDSYQQIIAGRTWLKAGDRLDVRYEDNALILKMVGKESIVDEVAGTVDTSPEILERRKRIYICFYVF